MAEILKTPDKGYWGRRAAFGLLKDLNCALATREVCQDMIGRREDQVLKAVSGLEGGGVASGSTCGVATGGALGLALMREDEIRQSGTAAEKAVLKEVGDYLDWYRNIYGSYLCRERVGLDFYKVQGQIRYLLPGDKMGRCFWHIRGAMRYLNSVANQPLKMETEDPAMDGRPPIHCATAVLARIREQTGIGHPLLEKLGFVFDGGVGFKGGICGALVGALMGVNQVMGPDVRDMSYWQNIKGFVKGHINLLRRLPETVDEPFAAGRQLVERFRQAAGAIECKAIISRRFTGWNDFQDFIGESATCSELCDIAAKKAAALISKSTTGL